MFAQTLIEAALECGRFALARALLAERTASKPNSPHAWKSYARALDGLGEASAAQAARTRADTLLTT